MHAGRALLLTLRGYGSAILKRDPPDRCRTRFARTDRPPYKPAAHWLFTGPLLILLIGFSYLWLQSLNLGAISERRVGNDQPEITFLDYQGEAFARLGGGRGLDLRLDQMSPWLPAAAVAIEDHRFYRHPGIDPIGLSRAMVQNVFAGRVVQGGSTISQQLAKLALVGNERSFSRKLKEAVYALAIETQLSKADILEAYLNKVYLGGGAYGVDAAAHRYFNKSAAALNLAESAMLAGLIKAPSRYAPTRKLEIARARAGVVLGRMVEAGLIEQSQADTAKAEPASLAIDDNDGDLGYFTDWVAVESRLFAGPAAERLTVQTTLDRTMQRHAEAAVEAMLRRHGPTVGADQVALVAMTPDGRVKAMIGGRSYEESQFNRAVQAERQPGSAFKLFLYLAALEEEIFPDNGISAGRIEVDGWQPRNADDAYPYRISIAHAFSHSVNTAAVRLAEHIGRDKIVKKARQLGITTDLHDHPSLALGSAEVTLLELTGAYATVANGGFMVWPEGLSAVTGADQQALYRRKAINERLLRPDVVDGMTTMLRETLVIGTGWRAQLPGFVAGKTGTSSDYRDAWFIGFVDDLVVGVWVGNDNGKPMTRVSGGGLPAMIFRDFMTRSGKTPALPPTTDEMFAGPATSDPADLEDTEGGMLSSLLGLLGG